MLRLLHMITLDHTLYDELRRDCNNKYYYIYCINTSLQVMKGTPIEECKLNVTHTYIHVCFVFMCEVYVNIMCVLGCSLNVHVHVSR